VSGAIGVNGTPDTRFRLDVNGSTRIRGSNPGFNLEGLGNGNVWLFQTVVGDGHFRIFGQDNATPGAERLTINMNGNIGIGVSNPTTKLQVGGDVRSSVGSPGREAASRRLIPIIKMPWCNWIGLTTVPKTGRGFAMGGLARGRSTAS
jgi:hypothetical protein